MRDFIIVLVLVLALNGCGADEPAAKPQEGGKTTASETAEGGNSMNASDSIQTLTSIFGCSERTAQSLYQTMEDAVPGTIVGLKLISANVYRILQLNSDAGKQYFAFVAPGYFLEKITEDAQDGKAIYTAIE